MNELFAIVRCEVWSRRSLLLVVGLLGCLPLLSPWLATEWTSDATEMRGATAMALSLLVTLGGAIVLGAQSIVGKQAEGRLGFFLARPISGWILWWGHLLAAGLLLLTSWWLIWLPTLLAGGSPMGFIEGSQIFGGGLHFPHPVPWDLPQPFAVAIHWRVTLPGFLGRPIGWLVFWWPCACVLLLVFSHWVAMVVRLRTRWVLLDVAFLGTAVLGGSVILGELYRRFAVRELFLGFYGVVAWAMIAALVAGAWQVAWGGVNASRSHRLFSTSFWSLTWLGWLVAAFYFYGMLSRGPEELKNIENFSGAPEGPWMIVSGRPWHGGSYEAVFAYHQETSKYHLLGPRFALRGAPHFSGRGNVVAWSHCPVDSRICAVEWLDLEGDGGRSTLEIPRSGMGLFGPRRGRGFALSKQGDRLALAVDGKLEVYEMPSRVLLAAHRLDSLYSLEVAFESSDQLRVYQQYLNRSSQRLDVWSLDLESREWTRRASLPGLLQASNGQGDRLLMTSRESGARVFDRWGQELVTRLPESDGTYVDAWLILSTGHLVRTQHDRLGRHGLVVFEPSGEKAAEHPLPVGEEALLGNEVAPGRVLVGFRRGITGTERIPPAWLAGLGSLSSWRTGWLDVEGGLSDTAWAGRLPMWQPSETFEQGRYLLSAGGIETLRPSTSGWSPVMALKASSSIGRPASIAEVKEELH